VQFDYPDYCVLFIIIYVPILISNKDSNFIFIWTVDLRTPTYYFQKCSYFVYFKKRYPRRHNIIIINY